jgi:hypothetical protein
VTVNRRRFAIVLCALVAVNAFFWLASSGLALPGGGLIQSLLGGKMIRAEVVWQAPDGSIQDTILYRGVITAVSPTTITLRERDRTETLPLSSTVTVRYGLQTASVQIHRGMHVVAARPGPNGSIDTIQVEGVGG